LDEYIVPDLSDPYAKTMATAISGLLRHVTLRLQAEGQAFYDDLLELRAVLTSIVGLLDPAVVTGADDLAKEIRAVLDKEYRTSREYPTLISLADEATEFNHVLDKADRFLLSAKTTLAEDERYQPVRDQIRGYATHQLGREMSWAFDVVISPGQERAESR